MMLRIKVDATHSVSGLLDIPENAKTCYVIAHGAGAGMQHPFMAAVAQGLFDRGIATLRYQFPYMEAGSKRPDQPKLAHATVRAAVAEAAGHTSLQLFAGGKSFGGRMTSQAQSEEPLTNVAGLIFLGFPLHAAGKPSDDRAAHLKHVQIPMLFLQGTKDTLADLHLLTPMVSALGAAAKLTTFEGADHSFHVPKKSGITDIEILATVLDSLTRWIENVARDPASHLPGRKPPRIN